MESSHFCGGGRFSWIVYHPGSDQKSVKERTKKKMTPDGGLERRTAEEGIIIKSGVYLGKIVLYGRGGRRGGGKVMIERGQSLRCGTPFNTRPRLSTKNLWRQSELFLQDSARERRQHASGRMRCSESAIDSEKPEEGGCDN